MTELANVPDCNSGVLANRWRFESSLAHPKKGDMNRYQIRRIKKHLAVKWGERLGRPECPYMRRWAVVAGLFSIRVHHFYRSDDERAFHDHPWWFVTLVVKGGYTDVSGDTISLCSRCFPNEPPDQNCYICHGERHYIERLDHLRLGSIRFRRAKHQHTVRTDPGGAWTVLVTGPNIRTWGFWERLPNGTTRFRKANKWFFTHGHHPCDQP